TATDLTVHRRIGHHHSILNGVCAGHCRDSAPLPQSDRRETTTHSLQHCWCCLCAGNMWATWHIGRKLPCPLPVEVQSSGSADAQGRRQSRLSLLSPRPGGCSIHVVVPFDRRLY